MSVDSIVNGIELLYKTMKEARVLMQSEDLSHGSDDILGQASSTLQDIAGPASLDMGQVCESHSLAAEAGEARQHGAGVAESEAEIAESEARVE